MEADDINYDNTGQIIDPVPESAAPTYHDPSENEKELISFIVDHTDRWRDYRDQNFSEDWEK